MLRLFVALLIAVAAPAAEQIKVVVVTMFERDNDTGDAPGEFQFWVEREKLDRVVKMPGAHRDLRSNGKGLLGMVTGVGTARAAASVMAVGLDPRFDFTKTYWLVAGIAGIDPEDGSVGSAAWADWVVDSDIAYEIDGREIPATAASGISPLGSGRGLAFQLDPALVTWAFDLTKGIQLEDSEGLRASRMRYSGHPNARRPPFVLRGDSLSGGRFWHGKLMNDWANSFMKEMTGGKGRYVTTAMEDSGTLQALEYLARAGKVDNKRVLVLRTASNYSMQPPDVDLTKEMQSYKAMHYSGYRESLEAAWKVGSRVVHEWLKK